MEDDDSNQGNENECRSSERHVMVGAAMKVEEGGMVEYEIAVRARGQPSFTGGRC